MKNPWNNSDVITYIEPARSYIETGSFLRNGVPDMHRTIGYPFFLATVIKVFGDYWPVAVYAIQIVIAALMFPAVTIISSLWDTSPQCYARQLWFLLIAGVGLAYVGQLLTDQIFTSLLIIGMASGMLGIRNKSWQWIIIHIFIIACAAQIRPTLSFFCFANFCFQLHTARCWNVQKSCNLTAMLVISFIFVGLAGNGPAVRNYYNYGVFTPTDVLSDNWASYLAGPVLISVGKADEFAEQRQKFSVMEGPERMEARKDFARQVIKTYPLETTKRVAYHLVWNLFEPHWEYIAFVFGKGFSLNSMLDEQGKLRHQLWYLLPFVLMYSALYLFFMKSIYLQFKQKNWLFLLGITVFLLPLAASLINGQGARMRLCVEPILVIIACAAVCPKRADD